jgi:2-dehydro-3-deoxyphosphogluconate aldolase/(4S)-4-hydroxy-2-oxoglutarate aldolase
MESRRRRRESFPANAVGGASYLKSVKAPLPQIELIPTGGVSLTNAADFIAAGAFALGVGADLVKGSAAEITEKARQYVAAVQSARKK